MTTAETKTPDQRLLRRAVDHSGLPVTRFSREVLARSPSVVFRWLAGGYKLPEEVRAFLREYLKRPSPSTERSHS